jgi:uncharacterized SAM-binding protein YcdF (DUF218 family)
MQMSLLETLESVRPIATGLLLPPLPLIVLLALACLLALRAKPWRKTAAALVIVLFPLLWATNTLAFASWLESQWVAPLRPIDASETARLRSLAGSAGQDAKAAILVLGGGRLPRQAETGAYDLPAGALARLRYGVRLHRATGLPLAFSGGAGGSGLEAITKTEAAIAADVLKLDYGLSFRWLEGQSRFTQESAQMALPMLAASGVKTVVLVTHAFHMPRSMRSFEQEASKLGMNVVPAPMAFVSLNDSPALNYMPSSEGLTDVRQLWREMLGWLLGR